MTNKRLIVRDGDYAWVDTTTGYVVEVEDAFDLINQLHEENEQLKGILLDILETSMETKALREVYCDGVLRIFDKANSLNQAREMIKEHLK